MNYMYLKTSSPWTTEWVATIAIDQSHQENKSLIEEYSFTKILIRWLNLKCVVWSDLHTMYLAWLGHYWKFYRKERFSIQYQYIVWSILLSNKTLRHDAVILTPLYMLQIYYTFQSRLLCVNIYYINVTSSTLVYIYIYIHVYRYLAMLFWLTNTCISIHKCFNITLI